jgi:hypothetical protein
MTNWELADEEMRRNGNNISRTARVLGIDYQEAREHYLSKPVVPFKPTIGPPPDDITSLGRAGFRQHVIAIKRAGCGWPEKYDAVLDDARQKYDAGTHEMMQGSSQGWVVQYLIPLKKPVGKRTYFSGEPIRV